jgi:predicted nucleotidyltransferase
MTPPTRSRSELLALLRAHEAELRARGVETLTLFGSMARGDVTGDSDVDLAVRPGVGFSAGGFDHFGRLANERQILRVLAATFKEPPPGRSPACRDQQALGPVVRKLQKPEPHQWHDGPFPERLFLKQLPSGRVRSGVAGTRHPAPSVRSPLPRMNRQMVQNAFRGRGGIKAQSIGHRRRRSPRVITSIRCARVVI